MPIVVTFLAIRAHFKDVREGKPTYLGAFFTSPLERRRLLLSGLKDFGKVFVVACVLDTTYQLLVLRAFYPVQMLIVAVALRHRAVLPDPGPGHAPRVRPAPALARCGRVDAGCR